MYRKSSEQISIHENPISFTGTHLDTENRWVKLAQIIPWKKIEDKYSQTFPNPGTGNPAKSCRMAIGSLIIKERMRLSDIETVELITENPYMQFFIGMLGFTSKAPFDASTMTLFRKRITPDILRDVNQMIIEENRDDQDPGSSGRIGTSSDDSNERTEPENKGTLILDATCAPADIHFPTDVSLLSEGREKLEEMIDTLHDASLGKKPRTYREIARKKYLRLSRNRKPRYKQIRAAIRQQLGYVRRDLGIVYDLLKRSSKQLTPAQEKYWETIQELYRQQKQMYEQKIHKVENRIVSIHQPWVRPIVRGKATVDVEFGAKISLSMVDGFAAVERLDWDAYNESGDLKQAVERYKEQYGFYPERILADKIYRTRANLDYCQKLGVRMNGPKLGRPPRDKTIYNEQKRMERMEAGERNAVEGKFGEGKRFYSLNRLMTRLQHTSEVGIHLVFLVMNLEKVLRDILLSMLRWLFDYRFAAAIS